VTEAPNNDLVRRLPGDPELAIEISEGIEHWRAGEITLTVDGSGAVEVRHRRAGEEHRYAGTLSPDELARFAARLAELGYANLATVARMQERDELTVTLSIRRRDEVVHRAEIPSGERDDDPRLAGVMAEYESLVDRVTEHDLPYGPAAAPR
jgi:hypothetical protein